MFNLWFSFVILDKNVSNIVIKTHPVATQKHMFDLISAPSDEVIGGGSDH